MSVFEAKNISFSYPKTRKEGPISVLSSLSFSLAEGERIALLGPSGCGKTTLLKVLAGLLDADEGEFLENGVDVLPIQVRDRNVAYAFQEPFLYPKMSLYANLMMALSGYKLTRDEKDALVKQCIIDCGLTNFINLPMKYLSKGEQQKVALARALIREPSLFLADEPFSALDSETKKECFALMDKWAEKGKTSIIYCTHYELDIFHFDHAYRMENGKLTQIK
ncbi:MAG: ABC transporter ATP-binding protein [Bacilli bacterium]|nr:ABC transporter ATP-binding protein [Bacilli bacterium]